MMRSISINIAHVLYAIHFGSISENFEITFGNKTINSSRRTIKAKLVHFYFGERSPEVFIMIFFNLTKLFLLFFSIVENGGKDSCIRSRANKKGSDDKEFHNLLLSYKNADLSSFLVAR